MDRLTEMSVFVRVVARRSFTRAAQDLRLPRSTVTTAVKQLEARLGVQLLERTTRVVSPTIDGEAYNERCLAILADVEDADAAFSGARLRGTLRIDVHGTFARHFILPDLPEFLERYPEIVLHIGEGDRLVDLVREGVDCVIRVGEPHESTMTGRRLARIEEITCASPGYLRRFGRPKTVDDLEGHRMIGFVSTATGTFFPLEFTVDGALRNVTLPAAVSVAGAETNVFLATLGLGIIQVPRYHVAALIAAKKLLPILGDYPPSPTSISVLYPQKRRLSPRVRVFIDWVSSTLARRGAELIRT